MANDATPAPSVQPPTPKRIQDDRPHRIEVTPDYLGEPSTFGAARHLCLDCGEYGYGAAPGLPCSGEYEPRQRMVARVEWRAAEHVKTCEHPHRDCYCDTHWHDDDPKPPCSDCASEVGA